MSILDDDNKKVEDGNGTKVEFSFSFKIFKAEDLKVYKITKATGELGTALILNTDYTVTVNKVGEGGKVIYTVAPTSDQQSAIYRSISITQPVDIPTDSAYVEKTLTNALDRACMISQQIQEEVDRCIKLPTFSGIEDVVFDTPVNGKATYWDIDGTQATLKNCETNPDDLVAECNTIKSDCDTAKTNCETIKDETEAIKNETSDIVEAALGVLPESQNISQWARDDAGAIVNLPLDSFKAGNTPFLKAITSDHKKIKILAPLFVLLELADTTKKYYSLLSDLTLDVITALDTGSSLTAGKDYYIYLCYDSTDGWVWKVSLNATYPSGYDEYTSRKLGGFHTLCRGVTAANAPRAGHKAIGYDTGDIIPNTVWAYNFKCVSGNVGKFFKASLRKWFYIYNASGNGATTGSVYGATRSHTRNYDKFAEDFDTVGDQMISQNEFSSVMNGSNYTTAVAGSAQPNPDTTGGHLDTAGKRMISDDFAEEGCGLQWQFTEDKSACGGSVWVAPDSDGKGQQYGTGYVVLAGGGWHDGGYTGPRCRNFYGGPSDASASIGSRGRSCHIEF